MYEGFKGDEAEPSVVIKETSSKAELVDGTLANFGLSELYMNQKLRLCGQGSKVARFEGHYYYGGDLCMVFKREGEASLGLGLGSGLREGELRVRVRVTIRVRFRVRQRGGGELALG